MQAYNLRELLNALAVNYKSGPGGRNIPSALITKENLEEYLSDLPLTQDLPGTAITQPPPLSSLPDLDKYFSILPNSRPRGLIVAETQETLDVLRYTANPQPPMQVFDIGAALRDQVPLNVINKELANRKNFDYDAAFRDLTQFRKNELLQGGLSEPNILDEDLALLQTKYCSKS